MATDHSHGSLTTAAAADDAGVNNPDSQRPAEWASFVRGNSEQMSFPTATAVSAAPGFSSAPPGQALGSGNSLVERSGHEVQHESSDSNSEGNAGGPKRPAWNMPSNGVVDGGSVMGGDISWPALSESTRPGLRSSLDSVRPGSDLPASSSQVRHAEGFHNVAGERTTVLACLYSPLTHSLCFLAGNRSRSLSVKLFGTDDHTRPSFSTSGVTGRDSF